MKLKLYVIGFFFCLIAVIGGFGVGDAKKPVPLPIDGGFSIQGKTNLSNGEIYEKIRNISETKKVKIYKPLVLDSDQVDYVDLSDMNNNDQLKSVPIIGMYYTLGEIDSNSLKVLTDTGLQVVYSIYPWYIGGILQFDGILKLLLMVSIYLTLLVVLFVVRMRGVKEGMIRRSLGLSTYNLRKDYLISFTFELFMIALLMIFYGSFFGQGLFTYSSKLFFSMILTNFILFQIVDIVTFILFFIIIRVEKPIEIIKNKAKNKLIFIIWLIVISIIIIFSGVFLQETKSSQSKANVQINNLEPWENVKDWRRIEFLGVENNSVNKNKTDSYEEINDSDRKYNDIAKSFGNLDFIYIKPSSAYIPEYMGTSDFLKEFSEKLTSDGITNPEVNKEMVYINKTGANLQNKINGTNYQVLDSKIATIYIPNKFEENKESIVNTVLAEQFTGTKYTRENLGVEIIPNGGKLFYFRENSDEYSGDEFIPKLEKVADSEDNIVVVLDTEKMIENNDVSLATNIVNNSLFSPEAIKKVSGLTDSLNFSINPVDVYQVVKLNIKSLEHQIYLSKIMQKIIFGVVFLLIYQYIQMFIFLKQSDFVKKIILGIAKIQIAIASLKYFIITIMIAILGTFIMTRQIELIYIGVLSLVVLIFSTAISFRKLSKKYTRVLKGDGQ